MLMEKCYSISIANITQFDYIRVDTIKDHLKSKKHICSKETKQRKESPVQVQVVAVVS